MEEPITKQIKDCIETELMLGGGHRKFIIFPFGDTGIQTKTILKEVYDIEPAYILDNRLCRYNKSIKPSCFLGEIDCTGYVLILAITNRKIYDKLKAEIMQYLQPSQIIELKSMQEKETETHHKFEDNFSTNIGKYSYGPLCRDHYFVESIGAFCSFAEGADVVGNHEMNYITTHPMICAGQNVRNITIDYEEYKEERWYFGGVKPIRKNCTMINRSIIGNDVWLGKNVIITNGANIGNGVIAGAGSIITKSVPDYAIVVGAPAKIVRFRYTPEQIEALNQIQWWNWADKEISDRFDDFYLPIEDFIKKYYCNEKQKG